MCVHAIHMYFIDKSKVIQYLLEIKKNALEHEKDIKYCHNHLHLLSEKRFKSCNRFLIIFKTI